MVCTLLHCCVYDLKKLKQKIKNSVDEFCAKIRAMKQTQRDPDFQVVARVEAFIAGWGLDEAVRRAEAYREVFFFLR